MITGDIKNQIDRIWDAFWAGGMLQAIEAVGASVIYLPPYSPALNPIENVFAKIKGEIRKRKPRTKEVGD